MADVKKYFRGDIYFCEVESANSIGSEQKKDRPFLIVSNNSGNEFSPTVVVIPLTQSFKTSLPTHVGIPSNYPVCASSTILCEQIRTLDKSRLRDFAGYLDSEIMTLVNSALRVSLDIPEIEPEKVLSTKIERDIYKGLYNEVVVRFIPAATLGSNLVRK